MATIERRWRCTECGNDYRRQETCVDCHGNAAMRDSWCEGRQEEFWRCQCGADFETADGAAEHAEWCKAPKPVDSELPEHRETLCDYCHRRQAMPNCYGHDLPAHDGGGSARATRDGENPAEYPISRPEWGAPRTQWRAEHADDTEDIWRRADMDHDKNR